jgi:hypothetical protein
MIRFGSTQCFDGCFICPKCGTHLSESNYMMAAYVIISSDNKLCGIKCCCGKFSYHTIYSSDTYIGNIDSNIILYLNNGRYYDEFWNEYNTTNDFVKHIKLL